MKSKKKKALFVATIYDFLDGFESNNMRILKEMGYEVHCIANPYVDQIPGNEKVKTPNIDTIGGIKKHSWRCARSPYDRNNIIALRQLQTLLKKENFNLVHCHTPMGGVLARIACEPYRKKGMRVIYTAHGFHFYKGAPKKNWLIYYPIEKELSRFTDLLITINKEDYQRAKNHFYAKQTVYIPGVGVDTNKFGFKGQTEEEIKRFRQEIGVQDNQIWFLSVGELNENKNHETAIRAIANLDDTSRKRVFYTIAGEGEKRNFLEKLIANLGLQEQVKLLGIRNDIPILCDSADVFVHPSYREGLSVALMEAMASGLPVLASRIRGNIDLIDEDKGGGLFDPKSIEQCTQALSKMISTGIEERMSAGLYNRNKIKHFDSKTVENAIKEEYLTETNSCMRGALL